MSSGGATLIDVTFVDDETGQPFLKLKLPARLLPSAFAAHTLMALGTDDWAVLRATPGTADEFIAAGRLELVMRKVQPVDPSTLLFSLPTVADEIPQVEEPAPADAPVFRLTEDDWLQLELIPTAQRPQVQADLDAVQAVVTHERAGVGFKQLHVRKALPAPFARAPLPLADLRARFGPERPVAWVDHAGVLTGCFAFTLPSGAVLYGQARDGLVVALGLSALEPEVAASLGLALIDWCAAR